MTVIDIIPTIILDHSIPELSISFLLCIILAIFAYWNKILDASGAAASFIIGITIAVFANIYWLITLISFLIVTYVVTRLDFSIKKSRGVAQGVQGERSAISVLANGSIPAIIAVFRFQLGYPLAGVLFITSICVAASDSFANEIGVLSKEAYLITNLRKRVRAGTDGGVSILGQGAALAGAFIPALLGWILISEFNNNLLRVTDLGQMPWVAATLVIPIFIGFLGCQIDSIYGATLQRKKFISNDQVNFLSILTAIIITIIIVQIIPF